MKRPYTLDEARAALNFLDATCPRDEWIKIADALKNEYGDDGFVLYDDWSATGDGYNVSSTRTTWRSSKCVVPVEYLFKQARAAGWRRERKRLSDTEKQRLAEVRNQRRAQRDIARQQTEAELVWWHRRVREFCQLLTAEKLRRAGVSKYLGAKKIKAFDLYFCSGFGIVIDSEAKTIRLLDTRVECNHYFKKENRPDHIWFVYLSRGTIAVPMWDEAGEACNFQFIFAGGSKKFIKHGRKKGLFHSFGNFNADAPIVICEGYATAASCHMATGWPCVVAFDCGNLPEVAVVTRKAHPDAKIVIAGDDDAVTAEKRGENPGRAKAQEAAQAVNGVTVFPKFARAVNG